MRLVIVGASLAGLRAAQAARRAGHDGELIVIGAEPHLPYTRPPLSKELLQGKQEIEDSALPVDGLDVQWRLGTEATGLDRARRRIRLHDGGEEHYDRLVIATGCRARRFEGPGANLDGVHTLRTLEDSIALRAALAGTHRLLVVGAGFIGCEVAASARGLGVAVTVIDIASHPLAPFGPALGERWAKLHRDHRVELHLGAGLEALYADDHNQRVQGARLSDATTVDADTVLIALGAALNGEWLTGSGLELDPGVACDQTLTSTHDAEILAAGDIASVPAALAGGARVRVEHWTTAAEHGQLAGRNALVAHDQRTPHTAPPYFWTDQYDAKIQALGCPGLAERSELLELAPDGGRFVAACVRKGGLVVGVVGVNAARRLTWYRRQLQTPVPLAELQAALAQDDAGLGSPAGARS